MNNITQKITTALATGSVVLATMSGPAFAENNFEISDNGAGSRNRIFANFEHRLDVNQENHADIRNDVRVSSNTGDNDANFNTGGNVRINTGDSRSNVHISNRANFNSFDHHHDDENNNDNDNNNNGDNDGEDRENPRRLFTSLDGENEVPGPGDPDGTGEAKVKLHPKRGELCVKLEVANIDTATAAHIHEGDEDEAGPVVVALPTPDANGFAEGCVGLDSEKVREIKENPSQFYVNVHNDEYPDGAVRGQLSN